MMSVLLNGKAIKNRASLLFYLITILATMIAFIYIKSLTFPSGDPYGDEAWYYYISKTMYWNWDPHLPFLPPIRFGFMILMHPFTKTLFTFRLSYILISLLPLLTLLYVSLRKRSMYPLLIAILYVSNDIINFYTVHVFTTLLAGILIFYAIFIRFYLYDIMEKKRNTLAKLGIKIAYVIILLLAVGSWEGLVPFIFALAIYEMLNSKKIDAILVFTIATLGILISFDNVLLGFKSPGWSYGNLTFSNLFELSNYYLILCLPLLSISILELAISVSQTVGLILINLIKGTALMNWYYIPSYMIYYSFLTIWYLKSTEEHKKPLILKAVEYIKHKLKDKDVALSVLLDDLDVAVVYSLVLLPFAMYALRVSFNGIHLQASYMTCCNDACLLTFRNILEGNGIRNGIIDYKDFWAYPYFISLINSTKPPSGNVFTAKPRGVIACYDIKCVISNINKAKAIIFYEKDYVDIMKILNNK